MTLELDRCSVGMQWALKGPFFWREGMTELDAMRLRLEWAHEAGIKNPHDQAAIDNLIARIQKNETQEILAAA